MRKPSTAGSASGAIPVAVAAAAVVSARARARWGIGRREARASARRMGPAGGLGLGLGLGWIYRQARRAGFIGEASWTRSRSRGTEASLPSRGDQGAGFFLFFLNLFNF